MPESEITKGSTPLNFLGEGSDACVCPFSAAIGLGLGGILGVGIVLNASAAGASIEGDATVSGLRNNIHYGKEEKALDEKIQEFKTEIAGIKHDYEKTSFRRKMLLQ